MSENIMIRHIWTTSKSPSCSAKFLWKRNFPYMGSAINFVFVSENISKFSGFPLFSTYFWHYLTFSDFHLIFIRDWGQLCLVVGKLNHKKDQKQELLKGVLKLYHSFDGHSENILSLIILPPASSSVFVRLSHFALSPTISFPLTLPPPYIL